LVGVGAHKYIQVLFTVSQRNQTRNAKVERVQSRSVSGDDLINEGVVETIRINLSRCNLQNDKSQKREARIERL